MAVLPHDLYAVDLDATGSGNDLLIDGIQDFNLSPEITEIVMGGDGSVYPTFSAIPSVSPRMSFSTTKLTALSTIGLIGKAIAAATGVTGLRAWFQSYAEGGLRGAGSTHFLMTMRKGLIVPRSLNAGQGGPAILAYDAIAQYDGTNEPVTFTPSSALSGTADLAELFTVGPVNINGTLYDGIDNVSVDFGITEKIVMSDGSPWPLFVGIVGIAVIITVRTVNVALLNTIGLDGLVLNDTDATVYFRKFTQGGIPLADATAEHIKLSVDQGVALPGTAGGSHAGDVGLGFRIICTYDGTNIPLLISTASAIT